MSHSSIYFLHLDPLWFTHDRHMVCLPFLYSGVSYVHSSVLLQTVSPSPDCALIESVSLTGSGHIDMRGCAGQVAYVQPPDLGAQ